MLLQLPVLFFGLPQGKSVVGALQVLDGRIPYRDFWTMYAPGQFYLTALTFAVFGEEVLFQGIVAVLIRGAIAASFFLLSRRLGLGRMLAAGATLVLAAGLLRNPYTDLAGVEINSYDTALLLLLISLNLMARYFSEGGTERLIWAGIWAGLAACFKHDVAGYVVAAMLIALSASWVIAGERRPNVWISPLRGLSYVVLGSFVFLIPVGAWFAAAAGADAWDNLFVWPATGFRKVMSEPYPPFLPESEVWRGLFESKGSGWARRHELWRISNWALSQLPQYVFVVAVGLLVIHRKKMRPDTLAILLMLLSGIALFWVAAHTQQNTHLFSMAVLSGLLMSLVWTRIRKHRSGWVRGLSYTVAGTYAVALLIGAAITTYNAMIIMADGRSFDLPGVRWIQIPKRQYDEDYPIAAYLRQHTEENEYIYVGPSPHGGFARMHFYFLSSRLSCCRYSEHHPGVGDRPVVQQEIISDLRAKQVRAIVLVMKDETAPPTELDTYILEHYSPRLRSDRYILMWSNDDGEYGSAD